jgi:AraC-like DNA-binding protein
MCPQRANNTLVTTLKIKLAIDENPLLRKKITDILRDHQIGRNQFQSVFKRIAGKPLSIYILSKRMEAAARMLEAGTMTEKEIAATCGYKGKQMTNSFGKAFKKEFQMTPTEWIKRKGSD